MKPITLAIAVCFVAQLGCTKHTDPVAAFRQVVARVPKQGTFALYKPEYHKPDVTFYVSNVKFNVTKTNSLVTPIVGVITFTITGKDSDSDHSFNDERRLEFAWLNNKWVFTGPTNLHYYNLDSEPFLAFLAPYRAKE